MSSPAYDEMLERVQRPVLDFLRALEDAQQSILFQAVASTQRRLAAASDNTLEIAADTLARSMAPPDRCELHQALRQVLVHLINARTRFVADHSRADFGHAFLSSRMQQCQALETLYHWRHALPLIAPYFRLAEAADDARRGARAVNDATTPVGLMHFAAGEGHNDYSLYVPEYYDPAQAWPLIVALHGGYGSGREYIWSWLRAAVSRGYLVLAAKSLGPTWSIMQPGSDRASVLCMLDLVCARYRVDGARIYLSGLSDGGTFSYLLGLESHQRFAALAPIGAVLCPLADPLIRARQGTELPLHVIHGALDAIFPVPTVRSTNRLLQSLGYQLSYTELPEWGHALTSRINEQLVLPWFESVHKDQ